MELELDMDLGELSTCEEKYFRKPADLGDFISRIQLLMEASRDSQLVLTVREYNETLDREALSRLQAEYLKDIPEPVVRAAAAKDLEEDRPDRKKIIAWNFGEAVGFIDASPCDPEPSSGGMERQRTPSEIAAFGGKTIRVDHLHVTHSMQRAGVSGDFKVQRA